MTSLSMMPSLASANLGEASTATTLQDMISTFQVDWLAVNQRLRRHPHEARILLPHSDDETSASQSTTTILHLVLQRRKSNYPPLQTVRLLLAIFPQAAWMGLATCASPLHILARHNPHQLDYIALIQSARPAVLPQDLQALQFLWDHFVHDLGSEQALMDLLLAFQQQQQEEEESDRKAARIYSQLASMLEYIIRFPLRRDIVQQSFGLHTIAALTADLELLKLALEVFPHQVNVRTSTDGRLPLHAFLATAANGRPLPVFMTTTTTTTNDDDDDESYRTMRRFRFPFDLLPLLRVLVCACPAALTTRDAAGQLPLHIAIAAGWNDFDVLLSEHPDSLHAVDGQSGWMLPFQLAAVSPASSLDTVYRLLRRDPAVLRLSIAAGNDANNHAHAVQKVQIPKNDQNRDPCPQNCVISNDLLRLASKVGEAECSRLWKSLQVLLTEDHRLAPLEQLYQPKDLLHHLFAGVPDCPHGLLQTMTHYFCCKYSGENESSLHWSASVDHLEE